MTLKRRLFSALWRHGTTTSCCGGGGIRTLTTSGSGERCVGGRDGPPFNVLFMGTDGFALETLKALHNNRLSSASDRVVDMLRVVSTSMKTPVADYARGHDLDLLTWPPGVSDLDLYDLGVLVSFGRMVPRKVIARLPHGILNVHPSLLPRWRGASPILHTVLNDDCETGVSIISIRPSHFDRGPIVRQERTAIPQDISAQHLTDHLSAQGARLLMSTLGDMPDILNTGAEQSDTGATYAHKLTSSHAWVDWEEQTLRQIRQQYLALHHKWPLRSEWNGQTVKLLDMVLDSGQSFTPSPSPLLPQDRGKEKEGEGGESGAVTFDPKRQAVCVKCADGWAAFRSVVLRKPMTAVDFYNGYLSRDKRTQNVLFRSVPNGLFNPQYWEFVRQPKIPVKKS